MAERSPATAPASGKPRRGVGKLFTRFLAVSAGAGVLTAVLASPVVVAAGLASNATVDTFNSLPTAFDQQPLSQQSKILYADGSPMATFYYENRIEVPLDQISPVMQQAIVSIEDSRFWSHGGVDPKGIARALVNNATGKDVQGASTLTQQWIKNVQVEKAVAALPSNATIAERQKAFASATESNGIAGYTRKLREIKLAIAADKKFSKKQILDNYLNITSFGDGQYGVEAASQHYFNLHAKDLPLADAALLAGMVQNPIYLDPVSHPDAALARRNIVLDKMLTQHVIDAKAHDAAKALTIAQQLSVQPISNGCGTAGGAAFFCDYVVKQFRDDNAFGGTQDDRLRELYRGGLTITTTLDPAKEAAAVSAVNAGVPANASSTPGVAEPIGSAIDSVEPGTGKILAMAQNRTYNTDTDAPSGSTSLNFSTDRQYGGSRGFQSGSSSKVFTLTDWLEHGHSLNESVNANEKTFANNTWMYGSCAPNGHYISKPYGPGNAADGEGSASMSVLQATYNSVNTAYAQMTNELQLCDIQAVDNAVGMHRAADGKPITAQPSMTLGVEEVAPLTVAAAYATFAAQGKFCTPVAITKITDADGKSLTVPAGTCTQAMSADVANGVTYALQQVLTKGTAAGNQLDGGRVAAGKTGTTNDNVAAWFTGYTPQIATSVWIGYPTASKDLKRVTIAGHYYPQLYGATVSAPIWKNYMNAALNGQPNLPFTDPPATMIGAASSAPASSSSSGSTSRPTSRATSHYTPRPTSTPRATQPPATQPAPPDGQGGQGGDQGGQGAPGGQGDPNNP